MSPPSRVSERPAPGAADLAGGVRARQRAAIARAISLLESGHPVGDRVLDAVFDSTGRAWVLGVTGPPGAGKSTLVDALVRAARGHGRTVAVLAVDPSSPFTRGALLGDRVRMGSSAGDDGVYVRSVASRGALGGIAAAVPAATRILDAAGFDLVVVETVGVGQSEVDVAGAVDCTVLVAMPGAGDLVQAWKAGVMEVGDLFVVNKADLDGAVRTRQELRSVLALRGAAAPAVHAVSARDGTGIDDLLGAVDAFRDRALRTGEAERRRRDQLVAEAERHVAREARERVLERVGRERILAATDALAARAITPSALARQLLDAAIGRSGGEHT